MEGNEEAVNFFRVCSNRVKGILCYEQLDIERLKLIKIKDKEYLICPKAVKFWEEEDLIKYKLKD